MYTPSVYDMLSSTLETIEATIIKAPPMLGQIYTHHGGKESNKFKKDGKTVIFQDDDAFPDSIETKEA